MKRFGQEIKRLGVGIVGIGSIGIIHLESVRRLGYADVSAICVRDQARGAALRDFYGIPAHYSDYRDLITDPGVDVVHICTPNDSHFEIAAAMLRAGKNVVLEKPLARDADEAGRLAVFAAEAEKKSGAKAAVNFPYRHHAMVELARNLVESGALGELFSVRGAYLQDWLLTGQEENWRLDPALAGKSRAVADIGSHWLDLARFLSGREVVEVCADLSEFVRRRNYAGTEDYGSILLGFGGGLRGNFSVSQASAGRKMGFWIEIDGSKASLRWDNDNPYKLWIGHRDKPNEELIYHPSMAMRDFTTAEPRVNIAQRSVISSPSANEPCSANESLSANEPRFEQRPERWPDPQKRMIDAFYRSISRPADEKFRRDEGGAEDSPALGYATFADGSRIALIVDKILESHEKRSWLAL